MIDLNKIDLKKTGKIALSSTRVMLQATIPTIAGIDGRRIILAVPSFNNAPISIEDAISSLLSGINLCIMLLSINDLIQALSLRNREQYAQFSKREWCLLGVLSLLSLTGFVYCLDRFGVQHNNEAAGLSNAAAILLNGITTLYLTHRPDNIAEVAQPARLEDGIEEAQPLAKASDSRTGSGEDGNGIDYYPLVASGPAAR